MRTQGCEVMSSGAGYVISRRFALTYIAPLPPSFVISCATHTAIESFGLSCRCCLQQPSSGQACLQTHPSVLLDLVEQSTLGVNVQARHPVIHSAA